MIQLRYYLPVLLCAVALAACGGSGSSDTAASSTSLNASSSDTTGTSSSSSSSSTSSSSGSTSSSSSGSSSDSSSSGSTSSSSSSSGGTTSSTSAAASLAAKLGKPSRLLVGLGGVTPSTVNSNGLSIDIYDRYLSYFDWPTWNCNPDYIGKTTAEADTVNAIPMFTLYQMATDGENNMAVLQNTTFMTTYWTDARLLFKDLGTYGKPALVNLEPDFWGFAQENNGDPTQIPAQVTIASECTGLPNNVVGVAQCLLTMARKYAPKAYIGFPPSSWAAPTQSAVIAYMNKLGAQNADFVTMQTLDRDAGCFEAAPSYCSRPSAGMYWDESNQTHPNFQDHLAEALAYHNGIGGLPLIWWQTPMGVPSTTAGGTDYHYRDNREHYFLTHPSQLTAVGGLAVVFSTGEDHQTNVTTDGGQFASLSSQYLASPAALP